MMTYLSLIDADPVTVEFCDPPIGSDAGPLVVASWGPHLRISMTVAAAESFADSIIETLAYRDDAAAYVPEWHPI